MVQYSSLRGCALGSILGGSDIVEVDVQDREQADSEEKEAREKREEEDKTKETINASTRDIKDDMQMD